MTKIKNTQSIPCYPEPSKTESLQEKNGSHQWFIGNTKSSGPITFTLAMILDDSGELRIGKNSMSKFDFTDNNVNWRKTHD